jgi:hypothetical protein
MLRQLQARADDLAECLAVSELEMRRSRTLASRLDAFNDFAAISERVDALRQDAEALHATQQDTLLDDLDRKVAAVMRSSPYRIVRWFATNAAELPWFINSASAYPLRHMRPC